MTVNQVGSHLPYQGCKTLTCSERPSEITIPLLSSSEKLWLVDIYITLVPGPVLGTGYILIATYCHI